jgi:hypothetical protein
MEEERKDALEVDKEAQKENEEIAEEKGRRTVESALLPHCLKTWRVSDSPPHTT